MNKVQKNFRKIPPSILARVQQFQKTEVIVATVVKVSSSNITKGEFEHVGIKLNDGAIVFNSTFLPIQAAGKFSSININGQEIKRKDLPKVIKTFYHETPNFGDWSKGSHASSVDREVYQRDWIAPKELEIGVSVVGEGSVGDEKVYSIMFRVIDVIDSKACDFEEDLLYCINLLYESVGAFDVYPADTCFSNYLETLRVDWEILPPGEREGNISSIISGLRKMDKDKMRTVQKRYDVLQKLRPKCFVKGDSGFRRYFGAKFEDDLVAFENVEYGNAMYIMFEDWVELSKKSRIELLRGGGGGFERVVHGKTWEATVEGVVTEHRKRNRDRYR